MSITRRIVPFAAALALAGVGEAAALTIPGAAYEAVSADGTKVLFTTDAALVPQDTNRARDLYVRDGTTVEPVTLGVEVQSVEAVSTSGDVVFFSTKQALLPEDGDASSDVYAVHPWGALLVTKGTGEGAQGITEAAPDGARAWFHSSQALVAGDTDGSADVYEVDVASGQVSLVSSGSQPKPVLFAGAGGGKVFFMTSEALVAGDTDGAIDVYFRDGGVVGKATDGNDNHATFADGVSTDGSRLIFTTAEQLAPGDTDSATDIYESGPNGIKLRSTGPNPAPAVPTLRAMSADGTRIVFETTDALTPGDPDSTADLYSHSGSATTLLSGSSAAPVVFRDASQDAQLVLFTTAAALLGTDTDGVSDLYRASVNGALGHTVPENGPFTQVNPMISPAGTLIAFDTDEPLVLDPDQLTDTYVRAPSIVGASFAAPAAGGNPGPAKLLDVTGANGTLFETAERIVPEDTNDDRDIYLRRANGTVELVSRDQSAPDTTLTGLPESASEGAIVSAKIAGTEGGRLECRVDDGAWTECAGDHTFGPLGPGQHAIRARAIDRAQNADPTPAEATVTVPAAAQSAATQEPAGQPGAGSQTTVAGTTGTTVAAADRVAPRLARLRLARRTARVRITFRLSEAAAVRVLVQRRADGRWRTVQAKRLAGRAGRNATRVLVRRIRPGLRIRLVARDAAGNRATPLAARLRVR